MQKNEVIENRFTYQKPTVKQQGDYFEIRELAKQFAYAIDAACPDSREKSLAMTKLQETVMWANASIALDTKE